MKDKSAMNEHSKPRLRRGDDGLGPTSDIGTKLRALYGSVQEEAIPRHLLDLLEQLDQAEERASQTASGE